MIMYNVSLQTALTEVDKFKISEIKHILCDTRNQRSYISDELRKQLRFIREKNLEIKTFGCNLIDSHTVKVVSLTFD